MLVRSAMRRSGTGQGGAVAGAAAPNHARPGFATILAAGILVLLAGPALAQGSGRLGTLPVVPAAPGLGPQASLPLSQTGVPAEATADNAVVARDRALAAGRRAAWDNLARTAGYSGRPLSDGQVEDLVSSIVIEEERTTTTRYAGRITVNFDGARVRGLLTGQPVTAAGPANLPPPTAAPLPGVPASAWVDTVASYRSFGEWLELRRRLLAAPPVASLELQSIAVDAARIRLGLRAPAPAAAAQLAPLGVALQPAGDNNWLLRLAGGG